MAGISDLEHCEDAYLLVHKFHRLQLGIRDKKPEEPKPEGQEPGEQNEEVTEIGSSDDEVEDSEDSSAHSESDFEEEEDLKKTRRESHKKAGPKTARDAPFEVMLTCYNLFERDSTEQKYDRKFLRSWKWSHLILDEAHAVKNSGAMRTVRLNRYAFECCSQI